MTRHCPSRIAATGSVVAGLRRAANIKALVREQYGEAFRKITDQRRNRRDDWFKYNPGHIDVCNIPLPVRTGSPGG